MTLAAACDRTAFVRFFYTSPGSIYLALVHYLGGSLPRSSIGLLHAGDAEDNNYFVKIAPTVNREP